jgi:hypothetical protein
MSPNPIRSTLFTGAAVALALVASPALAVEATTAIPDAPIVVAQTSTAVVAATPLAGDEDPVHLRGVRKAATESPEALRRYIWRTRMIYNHWYDAFAPKE